ncbi:DUF992 domain-containing protein [Phreatobacter sp.]|uniref:DUF992 domain-containing protein n=1 Tax=Phreatobacter sp. TaxID=1966341 RepID=UPI003F6FB261
MTVRSATTRPAALALAGAALLGGLFALPTAADAQNRVRAGVLTCEVAPGVGLVIASQRELACVFRPERRRGVREAYAGRISRIGLDVGVTGRGVLAWTVFAATPRIARWQLAGDYAGAGAQATLGVGLGANVLVGGSRRSVALQPLSVQAQTGLNLAVGVSSLTLRPARARR